MLYVFLSKKWFELKKANQCHLKFKETCLYCFWTIVFVNADDLLFLTYILLYKKIAETMYKHRLQYFVIEPVISEYFRFFTR